MERYMPITGIDCHVPSLLIDAQAPLDVLRELGAYRIRTATQLLESITADEGIHSELARVLATSLRDGCDLLDVVGRRLQRLA
jgi:hypothetical protein